MIVAPYGKYAATSQNTQNIGDELIFVACRYAFTDKYASLALFLISPLQNHEIETPSYHNIVVNPSEITFKG